MTDEMGRDEIKDAVNDLVRHVDPNNHNPNTTALWEFIRDVGIMRMNVKNMGYDLARVLSESRSNYVPTSRPDLELGWRASTQSDIESDWCAYWCNELKIRPIYHRKVWELAYVLHNMSINGVLRAGARGLGFGCGEEALPSYLAAHGVDIVATDLPPDHASAVDWRNTKQHTDNLEKIWHSHLVSREAFEKHVSLEYVDMNDIPRTLRDFDFCWSICAFEHLGSIEKGLTFIEKSMDVLRPGGVSIHTTEYNFKDGETIDNWPTVLFQKRHFEDLAERLSRQGHEVNEVSFELGTGPLDRFIDIPPYGDLPNSMATIKDHPAHIKLSVDGLPCTCYGLVIKKGG